MSVLYNEERCETKGNMEIRIIIDDKIRKREAGIKRSRRIKTPTPAPIPLPIKKEATGVINYSTK